MDEITSKRVGMSSRLLPLLVLGLFACGGRSEMHLGPLQHRLKPKYLAPVPIEEQQAVLDAEAEVARAKMAWEKAVYDVGESRVDVAVAKNNVDKERLEVRSCKERSFAAKRCRDTARIGKTTDELGQARKALALAKARRAYLKANHSYLKAQRALFREKLFVAEAKLELARSRVAEKHGIRPPGTSVDKFANQLQRRERQAATLADRSQRKLEEANRRRDQWQELGGQSEPAKPATTPPADAPAAAAPPADESATDEPATDAPPADEPSADEPPVSQP